MREEARYVCPICEKLTRPEKANLRSRRGGSRHALVITRWLWTCEHCGANHRDGDERLIK